MNARTKASLKLVLTAALAGLAIVFVIERIRAFTRSGEEGTRIWFYDQSEKRLYAVPSDTIPPHRGIGGKGEDGVRAVVVAFGAQSSDPAKLRIAYLETYAPPLKQALEQIHAAFVARKQYTGRPVSPESDFYQTNTLVKMPEDEAWAPLASRTGLAVTTKWRAWRGPAGEAPVVCLP